jgi:hypothetical protein
MQQLSNQMKMTNKIIKAKMEIRNIKIMRVKSKQINKKRTKSDDNI